VRTLDIKVGDYFKHCGLRAFKLSKSKAVREDGIIITAYKHTEDKVLTCSASKNGYPATSYTLEDGKVKYVLVHRLVAEAFVYNPDNLDSVDHINENKLDNSAGNLRWTSLHENIEFYNHKENRELLLLKDENFKLSQQLKAVKTENKELTRLHAQLQKAELATIDRIGDAVSKALLKLKKEAMLQGVADKTVDKLTTTLGKKFDSVDVMIAATAKPVNVNGVEYQSSRAAARFICSDPDITATEATVRKEIQRYVKGLRPSWEYKGKYLIGG